ncbi:MAG: efflux RND transporter periplasmic adaptor subunit [Candidatus Latescibacterota bacterium]|jgi:HlyD family secretion protein
MDRPLDPRLSRLRRIRSVGLALAGLAVTIGLLVWLPGWIKPSLHRDRIRTARVDRGPVEATLTASGTVVPEVEQVIVSPISSRVLRVLQRPGALLAVGQPILELDLSEAESAVARFTDELALKENQQRQMSLDLEHRLKQVATRQRLKELEVKQLAARLTQSRQLVGLGAVSQEQVREDELAWERAQIEQEQLAQEAEDDRAATRTRIDGIAVEMRIQEQEREEARRRLERAEIRADRAGVVTWVVSEEGASIGQGEVVARVADLRSFRIDATAAEIHAGRLSRGMVARVRASDQRLLPATVNQVMPTVENATVRLDVRLDDPAGSGLRCNQRVEVYLVTARKEEVLRLAKGPFVSGGEGSHQVFVVRGSTAFRTEVRLGLSGVEQYEVTEGLVEGDEVVISEVKDYLHLAEVKIE